MSINLPAILRRANSVTEGDTPAAELAQDVHALIEELADARWQITQLKLQRDQARGEA